MSNRDLRGKPVADRILNAVQTDIEHFTAAGWPPKLISITVGNVEAVAVYVRNQRRVA